jgi:hypothetical protein
VVECGFCRGFKGGFGFPPWFAAGRFVEIEVVRLDIFRSVFVVLKVRQIFFEFIFSRSYVGAQTTPEGGYPVRSLI